MIFKKREPNKYLVGKYIFAEWREKDARRSREGWSFIWIETGTPLGFSTDTEQNAILLMSVFDRPKDGKSA